jgi:hypothetical protein
MLKQSSQSKRASPKKLSPELVKAVSERVYALLQADLRLERERARLNRRPAARP